jgi:hypothetical protein
VAVFTDARSLEHRISAAPCPSSAPSVRWKPTRRGLRRRRPRRRRLPHPHWAAPAARRRASGDVIVCRDQSRLGRDAILLPRWAAGGREQGV